MNDRGLLLSETFSFFDSIEKFLLHLLATFVWWKIKTIKTMK